MLILKNVHFDGIILKIIALVFVLNTTNGNAQYIASSSFTISPGKNILYYVDPQSGNNQYMIPFIEAELKDMDYQKDKLNNSLFKSVTSLNFILSGDKVNDNLVWTMFTFSANPKSLMHGKKEEKYRKQIVKSLKNNQFFLKININPFRDLIEYQFVLFKIIKNPRDTLNYLQLDNYRTSSVFINPSSADYKNKLKYALRQLIYEANEPPSFYITANQEFVSDTIHGLIGNLTLQAHATDNDTPPEQITYKWQLGRKDIQSQTGLTCSLACNSPDTIPLTLTVSDGINPITKPYILAIKAVEKLHILNPFPFDNFSYSNNTYTVYTYHKHFRSEDYGFLVNFINGAFYNKYGEYNLYPNWTRIINRVMVEKSSSYGFVRFELLTTKPAADTTLKIKAVDIPYVFGNSQNLADKLSMFSVLPISPHMSDTGSQRNNIVQTFSIFKNENTDEIISAPTTKYFKVTNSDDTYSDSFQIEFKKISRISPFFNYSFISDNISSKAHIFNLAGVGINYFVVQGLSFDSSVGLSTSETFSSPVFPYYKLNGNINLINYNNYWKGYLVVSDLYKKIYSYTPIGIFGKPYQSRPGFGAAFESAFCNCQFQPISGMVFVTYYPSGYQVGSFFELGFRFNVYFFK